MEPADFVWRPSRDSALTEKIALAERIALAFRSLAKNRAEMGTSVENCLDRLRSLGDTRGPAACSPDVFSLYFWIRDIVRDKSCAHSLRSIIQDVDKLPMSVKNEQNRGIRNTERLGISVDLASGDSGELRSLDRGAAQVQKMSRAVAVALCPLLEPDAESLSRVKAGVLLMKSVWPEAYDEFAVVVHRLIMYHGHAVIGFTDFRYHGSIFFKHEWLMKRGSEVDIAEDLIHEAAHVRLNATMALTPLFTNDFREIYRTPLREDLRPMYGVFHQMFVLLRVAELYRRLDSTSLGLQDHFRIRRSQFVSALEVVKQNAALTPSGRMLLGSIEQANDELALCA